MTSNSPTTFSVKVLRNLLGWAVGFGCAVGAAGAAHAMPIGFAVQSDGDGRLYRINLADGGSAAIGSVGFSDVEGLSFQSSTGNLFGVDDNTNQLITIDTTTGVGSVIGSLGVDVLDLGLAFDGAGSLFLADEGSERLYSVNGDTGAATEIGAFGVDITALAFWGGTLFGINESDDTLVTIDTATAALTTIGSLGLSIGDAGLAFDSMGILWGIGDDEGLFTVDTSTGAATVQAGDVGGFESLAIRSDVTAVPEPATLGLFGIALTGLVAVGWRRRGA